MTSARNPDREVWKDVIGCTHLSTPWYLYLFRLCNACGGMYPIIRMANRQNERRPTTDVQRERGASFSDRTANSHPTDDYDVAGSHIASHADHLSNPSDSHPNRMRSTGNYRHYSRVWRTDDTEQQYTRAKVTVWSGFRTPDAQRSFSKKDPVQEAQNSRPGQDDQRADARGRLVRGLQMVRSDWTFCSIEGSETIRLVH